MSLPEPSAVAAPVRPAEIGAVDGVLPRELLFEVLLLLPAKEVCRVRAVCPSWRSLTYDPIFIAAHAARRPGPLVAVANSWGRDAGVDLVELSGDVVKRIRTTSSTEDYEHRVLCTHFNYVIVSAANHSITILEPISGSVFAIPHGVGEGLACASGASVPAWFALGQVPSTGCYKLLRIVEDKNDGDPACEIFTFGDGIGQLAGAYHGGTGHWKKTESPRAYLDPSSTYGVVVNGSAYFLFDQWQLEEPYINAYDMERDCIPAFNLDTESWSVALQGPSGQILEDSDGMLNYTDLTDRLTLSKIEGCLVTIHCNDQTSTTNLWFLIDIENNLWSKKIVIQNEVIASYLTEAVQVLWVLDDGKMILLVRSMSEVNLRICDPTNNTARNVFGTNSLCSGGVGIYAKSLLLNC